MLEKNISPTIFRAYDIRGEVTTTFTPAVVYTIARAFGHLAQNKVVIARDGRLSSPMLSEALIKGLLDSGCDVIDLGAVPTPLLYFASINIENAIMLTGSHNPKDYNGLKMILSGETMSSEKIKYLYELIQTTVLKEGLGTYQKIESEYLQKLKSAIHISKKLKVVVDAGNSICGQFVPTFYEALGCEVIPLFCEVDGNFPNHHPDPTDPKNLQDLIAKVKTSKADVGLAFDGDGDRVGLVTANGNIIPADHLLILLSDMLLKTHQDALILYDVKCSRLLTKRLADNGLMCATGHSLIKRKMKETKALLAGEMSGHLFFADRWYGFDDAIYAGARILEIAAQRSLDEYFEKLPAIFATTELKIAVADEHKFSFINAFKQKAQFPNAEMITIDGIRVEYENGWGLLRSSNTTPHLILRFEADSEASLTNIQTIFRDQLLQFDPSLKISF